ncbi:protein rep, partial [Mycobacterium tuberculosis]|nr:protein rep [Mycobacterium tuberculosis]
EVTRGSDGSAHPHFHTLMMVPPSMFTRDYVKHDRWVELWRECLRVNYDPNVDVRAVKPRKPKDGESLASATAELVRGAALTTTFLRGRRLSAVLQKHILSYWFYSDAG